MEETTLFFCRTMYSRCPKGNGWQALGPFQYFRQSFLGFGIFYVGTREVVCSRRVFVTASAYVLFGVERRYCLLPHTTQGNCQADWGNCQGQSGEECRRTSVMRGSEGVVSHWTRARVSSPTTKSQVLSIELIIIFVDVERASYAIIKFTFPYFVPFD